MSQYQYPPQQQAYGYPPPPQAQQAYGYPPPQQAYGYPPATEGYGYPQQQPPNYVPEEKLKPSAPYRDTANGAGSAGNLMTASSVQFNNSPAYKDLWALLLFIVHFVGYIIISVLSIRNITKNGFSGNTGTSSNNQNSVSSGVNLPETASQMLIAILVVSCVLAFFMSVLYISLMRR
jgi:hypothetical protein